MSSSRNRELLALIVAGITVALCYATVWLAQSKIVSAAGLTWGAAFLALMLAVHLVVRRIVPLADPWLLPLVAMISGIGIAEIYRLDPDLAARQTVWLVIAAVLLAALLKLLPNHHVLEQYKYLIAAAGVVLLLITISPLGTEVNGSKLWIRFPGGMQIQPGEFAKLGIVIFLAAYLREHREVLGMRMSPKHLGPLLVMWGASLGLLAVMNDFGTSLLFYGTFLLMLYVATARATYLMIGGAAFAGGSLFVYRTAAHVQQRFDIWLDPWKDAQGGGYQLIQGLYAMADGGLFGRGLGQAYMVTDSGASVIPFAHTDFIFAVIADEMGFVGSVAVLALFIAVAWRGFAIAAGARDGFSKLLAFGLATTFSLQAVIIVGGVVRLLPLTGQTLPFMSYGGSSLLANFLLIGLLLIVSHRSALERQAVT